MFTSGYFVGSVLLDIVWWIVCEKKCRNLFAFLSSFMLNKYFFFFLYWTLPPPSTYHPFPIFQIPFFSGHIPDTFSLFFIFEISFILHLCLDLVVQISVSVPFFHDFAFVIWLHQCYFYFLLLLLPINALFGFRIGS